MFADTQTADDLRFLQHAEPCLTFSTAKTGKVNIETTLQHFRCGLIAVRPPQCCGRYSIS